MVGCCIFVIFHSLVLSKFVISNIYLSSLANNILIKITNTGMQEYNDVVLIECQMRVYWLTLKYKYLKRQILRELMNEIYLL